MRVLSLFDGIACGRLALKRANIPVGVYYASEIDKNAIKVAKTNFPDIIEVGDVTKLKFEAFKGQIDLLIGGSPCQNLSICGDRKGLEGKESRLFFNYLDALNTVKPKHFLLENNYSMSKENRDAITKYVGVEPILINSSLVSAQNRKRLYWTNIPNVTEPEDKQLHLKDIIESGYADRDKSLCLTRRYSGFGGSQSCLCRRYFGKHMGTPVFLSEELRNKAYELWKENPYFETNEVFMRALTSIECERLQTLPDNYTNCIPETYRKQVIGNGWTVDVIAHIFKNLEVKCS